jgi:hypothetical protein
MSENAAAAAPAAAPEKKDQKVQGKKAPQQHAKLKKIPWTIQRCKKIARRFHSEAEWKAGAPSSYKSATAHGWVAECVAQYGGNLTAVPSATEGKKKTKARAKAKARTRSKTTKKTTTKKRTKKAA